MKKKSYEAPKVEVFEAKVEKGFAGSGIGSMSSSNVQAESIAYEDALFF